MEQGREERQAKLFTPAHGREELKKPVSAVYGNSYEAENKGKAMPGRHYWLIPFLFIIVYIETGFITRSFESLSVYSVNGIGYYSPSNYLTFYNSPTGPFSSIILSNFVFDGWSNLLGFCIYSFIFVIAIMFSPNRMRRSWFILIGSILSGILAMSIIRIFLPANEMIFGQSGVLAGFAGITIFFCVLGIINFVRNNFSETNGIGVAYFFGMCVLLGAGVGEGYGFIAPELPAVVVQAHLIALIIGIILVGIFTLFLEKGEGRGRKAPLLITEEEPELTGGGI